MKIKLFLAILSVFIVAAGFIAVRFYSFVFAKNVKGEIVGIERVTQPSAIISGQTPIPPSQIFSFAVAVRDETGEITTSSSEDRQWAVAQKGQCVEAKFLRYPPWDLEKSGTFFGARLVRLFDCPKN
ncbi:MAG: hypothetical protein AB1540_11805 [Bdellovibrionota bacterium]